MDIWSCEARGATFAAFPNWYATMFSGFYLALFLLLVGLILRGISFEYRSKDSRPAWRNRFDWMIASGSFLASLLLGAAFANLARGVPINENMMFTGNLFTLLNPFGLMYEEICASSLIKVNLEGELLWQPDWPKGLNYTFNLAGFVIHGAIHEAKAGLHCVIHTHSLAGMAVASLKKLSASLGAGTRIAGDWIFTASVTDSPG